MPFRQIKFSARNAQSFYVAQNPIANLNNVNEDRSDGEMQFILESEWKTFKIYMQKFSI